MKILVTDRADLTPKEIAKFDMTAHVQEGDPWPRWLAELDIWKMGEHEVADPEPPAPAPPEPTPAEIIVAALIAEKIIPADKADAIRERLNIAKEG